MASIGHIAVGAAATRIYGLNRPCGRSFATVVFWSALSLLPDADVVGFSLGVEYADEWGHRGATHSFAFAVVVGTLVGLLAGLLRRPVVRTGVTAVFVLASHPLLDILTDGGLGCAVFWPFDDTRYFAPWRPIPVAPIGLGMLSAYGSFVMLSELFLFAPLWWFVLRPSGALSKSARVVGRLGLTIWIAAIWLMASTDPLRERIVAAAFDGDTEFAPGFSESALAQVREGQPERDIRALLGPPLREFMFYEAPRHTCVQVGLKGDVVEHAEPPEVCARRGIRPAAHREIVLRTLGAPDGSCWAYSQRPGGGFFRARGVCFVGGRVDDIVRRFVRE